MNHEETLETIRMRSYIESLALDAVTREKILSSMPEPKDVPWDLVSDTIKAREEAVFGGSVLENMIIYYKEVVASAEMKLQEAQELKESLSEDKENIVFETWG